MLNNLEKYKKDLEKLIKKGDLLLWNMQYECFPEEFKKAVGDEADEIIKSLPRFRDEYQTWYSEAKVVIKQLLPDRLPDFVRHYEKPGRRREVSHENYCIEDYLQGLHITLGYEKKKVVSTDSAIPQFQQQLAILKSVSSRFESSLFDIQQLVQADIFDSDLEAARELLKHGFLRSAGAIAGVVAEKHLAQVANNHNVKTHKRNPTISDFNDLLKNGGILDTPSWRQIQRLGDIRNVCTHNKDREPTKEEVQELIDGVEKFTKTLF